MDSSPFSRGSFWPRDRTSISHIVDRHFTIWANRTEGRVKNQNHLSSDCSVFLLGGIYVNCTRVFQGRADSATGHAWTTSTTQVNTIKVMQPKATWTDVSCPDLVWSTHSSLDTTLREAPWGWITCRRVWTVWKIPLYENCLNLLNMLSETKRKARGWGIDLSSTYK